MLDIPFDGYIHIFTHVHIHILTHVHFHVRAGLQPARILLRVCNPRWLVCSPPRVIDPATDDGG